ncbi:MAG: hypothetical protein AAFO84_11870 [Cyanobacteria bacterium J06598_1]
MANASSESTSTALLALKRLVRGSFRQLGIALTALLLVLNLAGAELSLSVPASDVPAVSVSKKHPEVSLAKEPGRFKSAEVSGQSITQEVAPKSPQRPTRLLGPSLTHHHLTSARLSLPSARAHSTATLADASNR